MRRVLAIAGLVVGLTACTPPEPGKPITFANNCDAADAEKRVAIEGYPRLTGMMTMVTDTILITLFEQPDEKGKSMYVSLKVGTDANQIENLPENYSKDDLKIRTKENQVVSTDNKIKVHGKLLRYPDDKGGFRCQLYGADLVEDVPDN